MAAHSLHDEASNQIGMADWIDRTIDGVELLGERPQSEDCGGPMCQEEEHRSLRDRFQNLLPDEPVHDPACGSHHGLDVLVVNVIKMPGRLEAFHVHQVVEVWH